MFKGLTFEKRLLDLPITLLAFFLLIFAFPAILSLSCALLSHHARSLIITLLNATNYCSTGNSGPIFSPPDNERESENLFPADRLTNRYSFAWAEHRCCRTASALLIGAQIEKWSQVWEERKPERERRQSQPTPMHHPNTRLSAVNLKKNKSQNIKVSRKSQFVFLFCYMYLKNIETWNLMTNN